MPDQEAPRRLRAQDVIDAQARTIEQLLTRSPGEPYVTVEHTLNAKGDTQTSVKVSAPASANMAELEVLCANVERAAADVYDEATARYPRTKQETK
jgi:hypothetical protein